MNRPPKERGNELFKKIIFNILIYRKMSSSSLDTLDKPSGSTLVYIRYISIIKH